MTARLASAARPRMRTSIALIPLIASSVLGVGLAGGSSANDAGTLGMFPVLAQAASIESRLSSVVVAWGQNDSGQSTVPAEAQSGVTAIAAGLAHSLALKDGRVIAWGNDGSGRTSVPLEAQSGVTAIAAGGAHSLALKDGRVIAWGYNDYGLTTVPEVARSGVTAITAGFFHSMALSRFGEVIAWGQNDSGQSTVPAEAQSGVTAIAAGNAFSLALKSGQVIAWGSNFFGQSTVPAEAQSGVAAIAAGGAHSLALKDGRVIAWGRESGKASVPPVAESSVIMIAAGGTHSLANRVISGAPDAPTGVLAVPGDQQATVSWVVPKGSQPAFSFEVTSSPGGHSCSSAAESCTVSGLRNGIAYSFRVVAANQLGFSPQSQPSVPITPRGRPLPPQAPSGIAGNGEVLVSWQPPLSDGGSALTAYTVAATPGSRSCSTTGALSCRVSGLTNGVAYSFAVAASNQAGVSTASAESAAVTPSAALSTSPRSVSGSAGNGLVVVSWSPPSIEGDSPITRYTVTVSPGAKTCSTTGELTCTITGLTNGTPYTFTVTASNSAGISLPSEPSAQATPVVKPGSVTNLKATSAKGSLRVTWSPPTNTGGAISVTYQYQVGRQAWKATSATSVTVRGKKGVRIAVKVRAVNLAGFGPSVRVARVPR